MSGRDDSRGVKPSIDAAAKAGFLAALRRGERREDAAATAGFSLTGFYGARSRDPAFAADWQAALAAPPAASRRLRAYELRGEGQEGVRREERITPANRRLLQRRRRLVRFDAAAQEVFLGHLAWTCDFEAAAEAAGVSASTATYRRRRNPEFAAACEAALAEGREQLETEVLRQRLAEQARLRRAIEAAGGTPPPRLKLELDAEFDRTMNLLARLDRASRRPDRHGPRGPWTFDRAVELLDKRLRALGVDTPPPGAAGEGA
jgi:hypothetical protein